MFRIKIRQQKRPGERWQRLAEATTDLSQVVILPNAEASESDLLSVQIVPPGERVPAIRIFVGSVLVASNLPRDRVILIDSDDATEEDIPPLVCKGRLFADWVGLTELIIEVRPDDASPWSR